MERELPPGPGALAARLRHQLNQSAEPPRVCKETVDTDSGDAKSDALPDAPAARRFGDRLERLQAQLGLSHINRWVLVLVAVVVAAVGLSVTILSWPRSEPAATAPATIPETATAAPEMIVVSVAGAVKEPGIVELESGSRVADAIEAAGGLADGADPGFLNLARVVADGDLVAVPDASAQSADTSPDGSGSSGGGGAGGLVNINVADEAALASLNGIGPVLAERIVAYRESNGSFHSIDELSEVQGVGPKMLEQLREQVTL